MTPSKVLFAVNVLIVLYAAAAQYDTYEHSDEEEEHDDTKPRVDYTKYFGGLGAVATPGSPAQAADGSSGFVQPLDFTGLFAGGHFGLDGLAGGASHQVYQTPDGIALPFQPKGLSVVNDPLPLNQTGFVSEVKFPSLFDSSGSSSENGFRPQDFLQQGSVSESTSPRSFYSPSFASLQRDVDREVDYQRKEEDHIERSRLASRRDHEYDAEDDDDDIDSFEFDDGPESEYRSSPKRYNTPHPSEREKKKGVPNRKHLSFNSPYSTVSQVNLRGPSRPQSINNKPKTPLPSLPEPEDDYVPLVNHRSKQHEENVPFKNVSPIKPTAHYYRPLNQYNSPSFSRQPTTPYISNNKAGNPKYVKHDHSYYSAKPILSSSPLIRAHDYRNKPSTYFRSSSRDSYSNTPQPIPYVESETQKQRYRDGIYPLPQTEYATVVEKKIKQPDLAQNNKKGCKKINKRIDPDEFARFKRQQMTCYICTNKEKGNTYEECSYESDPKSNSFYKGSAESFSSDTVLTPAKVHKTRKRRSAIRRNDNNEHKKLSRPRSPAREAQQLDYDYDPDKRGHGPEHYRFGPEYFKVNRHEKEKLPKQVKRTDYDEEYDENEDEYETDVEKEYEPPGASENDDCRKVNRNGLICMVCKKPSGGSYEQCSYASDPEANRYEYAKSSSYGSKRPQNLRYKRYSVKESYGRPKKFRRNSENKKYGQHKKNLNRRGDFRNGKLKRKKVTKGDVKRPLYRTSNYKNANTTPTEEDYPQIIGLDPFFYGYSETYNPDDYDDRGRKIKRRDGNDEEAAASYIEDENEDTVPTYEDSFYRLFPELVGTDPYTGESLERKEKEKETVEKRDDIEHPRIPYEETEDEEESESVQTNSKVRPSFEYGVELPDYYFDDDASKKDLEKTLDEFTHKNRSDCKKVMKDKMTCYQCINKNGLQHEECMFVAASEPKNKHLAYHEVKEFRITPTEKSTNDSINNNFDDTKQPDQNVNGKQINIGELENIKHNDKPQPKKYDGTKKIKKRKKDAKLQSKLFGGSQRMTHSENTDRIDTSRVLTQDILKLRPKEVDIASYDPRRNVGALREKRNPKNEPVTSESRNRETPQRRNTPRESSKEEGENEEGNSQQPPVKSNYNSIPPDPEGFDEREGPEGAYSHETEPVYDSVLKITLPRYMLTRSEHEDIFDEVFRSG